MSSGPKMTRAETFDNLFKAAKGDKLGADFVSGGINDPMCLMQHVRYRLYGQWANKALLQDQGTENIAPATPHEMEVVRNELETLANFHNRECQYLSDIGRHNGHRVVKLRDTTEMLDRICQGERVQVGKRWIDVNVDFARLVEEELAQARAFRERYARCIQGSERPEIPVPEALDVPF